MGGSGWSRRAEAAFTIHLHPNTVIAGAWPPLPAGTAIFAQAWCAAGGSFAASNALQILSD